MSTPKHKAFGVLLTKEAWADAQVSAVLKTFAKKAPSGAMYFVCREIDSSDIHYFIMTPHDDKDASSAMDILIPHHYVKLVLAAPKESQIGFSAI